MLESQGLQRHQPAYKNDKEVESSFGKWTLSQPVGSYFTFNHISYMFTTNKKAFAFWILLQFVRK